jgi:transmembrane sensor
MMDQTTEGEILDEAAAFAGRAMQAAECAPQGLEEWLGRDPRHEQAYRAMTAVAEDEALAQALVRFNHAPQHSTGWTRRRAFAGWAMAAAVAGLTIYNVTPLATDMLSPGDVYRTEIGQTRTIALKDGTHITLNGGTEVRVSGRRVALERGQAYFAVAHDPAHPFVVSLPAGIVTVLGTQFDLSYAPEGVELEVYEGSVRLAGDKTQSGIFRRGERGRLASGSVQALAAFDLSAGNWRSGWIEPKDWTLEHVAQAMSRRTGTPIRFAREALKAKRITGRLRLLRPEIQLQTLAEIHGFSVIRDGNGLLLR